VIITLHVNGDAMCSHGNLATTARSPLRAPRSLQRPIEQIAREHTSPRLYLYYGDTGRIWRFRCKQVRQIKPTHLAFGRTIK